MNFVEAARFFEFIVIITDKKLNYINQKKIENQWKIFLELHEASKRDEILRSGTVTIDGFIQLI